MIQHKVHASPSREELPRQQQLAWKMAEVAADPVGIDEDVADMIINRIIDNASVAVASLNRGPVKSARAMAKAHARNGGATLVWGARRKNNLRRMGCLGQWHGGARTGLSRHVSGRRLFAPRRQYPADPRGSPAMQEKRP